MAKVLKEQQGKVLIYGNKAIKYPEPTKSWFYVTEYDSNGYPIKAKTIGCSGDMPYVSMYSNTIARNLKEFVINGGVTKITDESFSGCSSLTRITIPDSVTSIGSYAFNSCKSLTSITIPEKVTSLKYGAFYGCSSLTSITIPDGITRIEDNLLNGCTKLTSILFPSNLTEIQYQAFQNCSSCLLFDFRNVTKIPTLQNVTAFNSTSTDKKIVVPDSLYDTWITATNWSSTTNNIVSSIIKASDYEASL